MPLLIPFVVEPGSFGSTPQPSIAVDLSLLARPWRADDAPAVRTAFADPDIQRWHFRRHDSLDESRAWVEQLHLGWQEERLAGWAVVDTESGEVLGRVALTMVPKDGYGEISYWVLPAARGRGVATRAVVAVTHWAHAFGLHRVELQHSTRNERSGRVAAAAGFTCEGVRRGSNLHDDGWHDMQLWSHLATD